MNNLESNKANLVLSIVFETAIPSDNLKMSVFNSVSIELNEFICYFGEIEIHRIDDSVIFQQIFVINFNYGWKNEA